MTRSSRLLMLTTIAVASLGVLLPQEAEAQRRAVRRPAGRSVVVVSRPVYRPVFAYRPYYYAPYFWGYPSYWGLGFGWGYPSYWGQRYPYPPYGYGRYAYDRTGSARIQVTPREAQVYVDGYFVGLVDDFDGRLQRLHVEAGEHELAFYLDGYKTIRERVLFRPGATLRIEYTMQPLAPGEANDPKPEPDPAARDRYAPRDRYEPGRRPARDDPRGAPAEFGTLSLRVQPHDATVIVNGEEWDRPEGEDRFFIDLPEGTHRVEVRKDGFRTYARTIQVRRGQTVTLNVSLTTGSGSLVVARR